MDFFIAIAVLFMIDQERKIFRQQDAALYQGIFSVPLRLRILLCILFLLVCAVWFDFIDGILVSGFICFLAIYLIGRARFCRSFNPADTSIRYTSEAYGVVLSWILGLIVISLVADSLWQDLHWIDSELGAMLVSAVLSSLFLIYLIYKSSLRLSQEGFWDLVALKFKEKLPLRHVMVPALLGILFAALSSYVLITRKIHPVTPLDEVLNSATSSSLFLIFFLVAILFAPLAEEIMFRGYFFHVIKKIRGERIAIVAVSLIFGFLHFGQYWGDWMAIAMVMALGFVLTFLRAKTGTTISSVIMHYMYNAGVTMIPVAFLLLSNASYFQYVAQYDDLSVPQREELLVENISRNPEFSDAYNDLAWLYAEEGKKLPEALELIDKALEYEKENAAYLDTKAVILEAMGREEEARPIRAQLKELGFEP